MNKEQLLELVDQLDLPKDEYYILSTGSLLLHGLREKANDLDLCVSTQLFKELQVKFGIELSSMNKCGFYPVVDLVEIVPNEKENFKREFQDGYPVESLQSILDYKMNRNAPKDQLDIVNIQNYLQTQSKES